MIQTAVDLDLFTRRLDTLLLYATRVSNQNGDNGDVKVSHWTEKLSLRAPHVLLRLSEVGGKAFRPSGINRSTRMVG